MRLGRLFVVLIILAGAGFTTWYFFLGGNTQDVASIDDTPYTLPALTKPYTNNTYRFSVMMPADFEAQEVPADINGVVTIVLQNPQGEGIQIALSSFDEDLTELTKARIMQDVPDLRVSDEQVVEIGISRKGLAFKSDNEAFNGASREVWFVFRGQLYQISTYERLDPLLQAMFSTWQFL